MIAFPIAEKLDFLPLTVQIPFFFAHTAARTAAHARGPAGGQATLRRSGPKTGSPLLRAHGTKRIFNLKAKLTRANIEIRSLQKGPPHIALGRLILDRKLRALANKTEYSVVDGKDDRVIVCPGFVMSAFVTHIKKRRRSYICRISKACVSSSLRDITSLFGFHLQYQ